MASGRAPLQPIIVAGDVGNATTSVAVDDRQVIFFPSAIAEFEVGPFEGMSQSIGSGYHHVSYRGRHAVIGVEAMELSGSDTLLNDTREPQKRYTDDISVMCFLAGVSALYPNAETLGVSLATGAPLSLYQAHGAEIIATYHGVHEYIYNGQPRRALIEDVRVFGEGRESWRLMTPEQRAGNVALHDLGGKTWNVLLFTDGVLRSHRTFDLGVERLLDKIAMVPRDPGRRWAIQSQMRKDPKAQPELRAELARVVAGALRVIENKVNLPRAQKHALIGGGALHLPEPLRARYPGSQVFTINGKQPEIVNALAYVRAMRGEA